MTNITELQQKILELAQRFSSFSGKYGDWARAIVNKWNGENLTISADSAWIGDISGLSRLELVQRIVSGEPERLGMVSHTGEWMDLKKWVGEWQEYLLNNPRERERERERSWKKIYFRQKKQIPL